MKMPRKFLVMPALGVSLILSGCSSFDEALGKAKTAPDEFQVIVRPPLTLPPNFNLRPGDEEVETSVAAAIASDSMGQTDQVFTSSARANASSYDALFGTGELDPEIRQKVDEETLGVQLDRRLPIQILFGGQPNVGPNLSAAQEAERIRKAIEAGESVTATPTPAVDPVEKTTIAVE